MHHYKGSSHTCPSRPGPPQWRGPGVWAGVLLLLVVLAGCAGVCGPGRKGGLRLIVVDKDHGGRVVFTTPVRPGQRFTVWFLHSYDRAFFAEHYQVLGPGRILLTSMSFKSNLNGEGFVYTKFRLRPDGVGELVDINEVRTEVEFMMGSPDMANHTLIISGRRIPLVRYCRPRTLVAIRVVKAGR